MHVNGVSGLYFIRHANGLEKASKAGDYGLVKE